MLIASQLASQLLKIDKISYDRADFLDFIQQIW